MVSLLCCAVASVAQLHVTGLSIDNHQLHPYEETHGTVTISEVSATITKLKLFSSEDVVTFPKIVKVPPGQLSAGFTLKGKSVTERVWTTMSAAIAKDFVRLRIYVEPPVSATIRLTRPWLVGGSQTSATLDVYAKSGSGPIDVELTSSDPAVVSVPSVVEVHKGKSTVTFDISSFPVDSVTHVQVGGVFGGHPFGATLEVRPALVPQGWYPIGTNANMLNNGGKIPAAIAAGADTTVTVRMQHVAANALGQDVHQVRLVYANYDTEESAGEHSPTNTITVKASIEKMSPDGPNVEDQPPIPVLFNGAESVDILPGDYAVSDPVDVDLVNGEKFYTRTTQSVALPTMTLCGGLSVLGGTGLGGFDTGEGVIAGDYAAGGFITPNAAKGCYSPSAILGYSDTPLTTLALCGDSILSGTGDGGYRYDAGSYAERAATRQFGMVEDRNLPPLCGYVHTAKGGERALDFVNSGIRFELSCLADTVVANYINNDIGDYDPVRYTEDDIKATIVEMIHRWTVRGKRVVYTTCNPKVVSTDGLLTVGNQMPLATEWLRLDLNAWIRDPDGLAAAVDAPGQLIIWDICPAIEVDATGNFAVNGGRWASAPVLYDTGAITTKSYLSAPSFKDKTKSWQSNELCGMSVTFTSGANSGRTRVVAYNDRTGHVVLRGGYSDANKLGDAFIVTTGVYSIDGTHPTSWGHAAIAATFPYDVVFGPLKP